MFKFNKVDELQKKRKEKLAEQQQYVNDLKTAIDNLQEEKNLIFFLKFINKICGWNEQSVDITPNELIYKKGKRDIWVALRNVLPRKVVAKVEIY